ncbi:MAG TPA: ATP-binding protein [Micromonosporaceae bacterium]|nr:ATP-binding protein [Micromonosporaceae bacterium]
MASRTSLVARRAFPQVLDALGDTRVVVLNGARQVGKSTLAETVLRHRPDGSARFLDDVATRAAAQSDPTAFVRHDGLLFVDEVQRVPDLWLAIKHEVDRDPRPGRFLLTGSARLLALRALPDALVGRAETIELWPLSQGEIDDQTDGFVDAVFEEGTPPSGPCAMRKRDYLDRVARGGYPEAVRRDSPARRRRFFDSYVSDLIVRDVQQVAEISRISELRRLLALLAGQAGGLLTVERLAGALALHAKTVAHYLDILETIFVVRTIPGWTSGAASRAVAKAKLIFVDSGLAAHLNGTLASGQSNAVGGLLENFVLGELARQLTWSQVQAQLFHYRDRDQYEVDALIEASDGRIVGVEVKASETVRADDFRGLGVLQRRLGDRFVGGYVLYCGENALNFGAGMRAVPISALWRAWTSQGDEGTVGR